MSFFVLLLVLFHPVLRIPFRLMRLRPASTHLFLLSLISGRILLISLSVLLGLSPFTSNLVIYMGNVD